jgi:pimeloyl-ACP methyl ester carboxylesterase
MRYNLFRGEPMIFDYGGQSLYYERQGAGKPLLVLHGWGGRIESWLPLIRDFSPRREVVALDFPGAGRSPEPREPWSVTEYMELTAAFLRQLNMAGVAWWPFFGAGWRSFWRPPTGSWPVWWW